MKRIIHNMFLNKHFLPVALIFATAIYIWKHTLTLGFFGEGYYYFDPGQDFFIPNHPLPTPFETYDLLAKFLFDIFPPFFHDNLTYYLGFQLITTAILGIALYFFALELTKSRLTAFFSSIFFVSSFIGLFEMIGVGNYQRFVQRITPLIPGLISLTLFNKSLNNKLSHPFHLVLSFIFFFLSLTFGQFASFLTPVFLAITISFLVFKKTTLKKALSILIFPITNLLFLRGSSLTPETIIANKIGSTNLSEILANLLLQIANIHTPNFIGNKIVITLSPFEPIFIFLSLFFISLYFLFLLFLFKRKNQQTIPVFTLGLSVILILLLNVAMGHINPKFNFIQSGYYSLNSYPSHLLKLTPDIKGDRYYTVPVLFLSIIWSIMLTSFLPKKPKKYIIKTFSFLALVLFLLFFAFQNTKIIEKNLEIFIKPQSDTQILLNYFEKNEANILDESFIVTHRFFIWTAPLLKTIYHKHNLSFVNIGTDYAKEILSYNKNQSTPIFLINYNFETQTISTETFTVKDLTENKK